MEFAAYLTDTRLASAEIDLDDGVYDGILTVTWIGDRWAGVCDVGGASTQRGRDAVENYRAAWEVIRRRAPSWEAVRSETRTSAAGRRAEACFNKWNLVARSVIPERPLRND